RPLAEAGQSCPSSANGWHSARASAPWSSTARDWPRCWKPEATTPPSACTSCRPGAARPRKAESRRCRPTLRD
ncbi:hypothetical protein SM139_3248, partial [Stenotrophomonas maltophilia]